MKFQIFSDLHLEMYSHLPKIIPLCDILILSGDIGNLCLDGYKQFIDYCSKNWKHVLIVLGNHEFYGMNFKTACAEYDTFFKDYTNVYLLDNTSITIDDYVFVGSTFWTKTNKTIQYLVNDFNQIENFKYDKYILAHEKDAGYLTNFLNNYNLKKKLIVITHFPPCQEKVSNPKYDKESSIIKNYFAHNFDKNLINKATIWIYGHTHWSNAFKIGSTTLISNQMGYNIEEAVNFNPEGIYEL
jgi:predicted phosphohydrolase